LIDEQHLRHELESTLGRPVPAEVWALLVQHGRVRDYNLRRQTFVWLQDRADELLHLGEARAQTSSAPAGRPEPMRPRQAAHDQDLISELAAREAALSDFIAEEASSNPELRQFRHVVLSGTLLDWEEVERWIDERVRQSDPPTLWINALMVPPEYAEQLIASSEVRDVPPLAVQAVKVRAFSSHRYLWYVRPDATERAVPLHFVVTSPLTWLARVSRDLSQEFGWSLAQATVFALTGMSPWVKVIKVTPSTPQHIRRSRVLLSVDPMASPEEVAATYRAIREQVVPMGQRQRSITAKEVRLAMFYRSAVRTEHRTWEDARQAWNARYPHWENNHATNFQRDALRAYGWLFADGQKPLAAAPETSAPTGSPRQEGPTVAQRDEDAPSIQHEAG
jgi:hypothetical protein